MFASWARGKFSTTARRRPRCSSRLPGAAGLKFTRRKNPTPERGNNKLAGFRHIALRVDSIDDAKAELEKRGVKFAEEIRPAAGGGRVLFFEDGEGNLLHFVERPADFKLQR